MNKRENSQILVSLNEAGGDISYFTTEEILNQLNLVDKGELIRLFSDFGSFVDVMLALVKDNTDVFNSIRESNVENMIQILDKINNSLDQCIALSNNFLFSKIPKKHLEIVVGLYITCRIEALLNKIKLAKYFREELANEEISARLDKLIHSVTQFNSNIEINKTEV